MAAKAIPSNKPPVFVPWPLIILALGTISAFLVAINKNLDNLAHLWNQCSSSFSSSSSSSSSSPSPPPNSKLQPTALCFAVLFFQTALDSTRARLKEAVIIGFLAGLATITAVESAKYGERQDPVKTGVNTTRPQQREEDTAGKWEEASSGKGIHADHQRRNSHQAAAVSSRKVIDNLTIPWLLYNLAAGALAWQAIIIPAFLHEQLRPAAGRPSTSTHLRPARNTMMSEIISILLGVTFGLLIPSTLMIVNPTSTATILVWLFFPIWVSLIQRTVRGVMRVRSPSDKNNHKVETKKRAGPIVLMPYAIPMIYSTVSHVLLAKNMLTEADDRGPLTRSAVLLLEIDHLAIFLAFLYWVWARTVSTTKKTSSTAARENGRFVTGLQPVLITLVSGSLLGPGAGACLGWVSSSSLCLDNEYKTSTSYSRHHRDVDCGDAGVVDGCHMDRGQMSVCSVGSNGNHKAPSTPTTGAQRCRSRARSSPKATGHFFGGPLAD